MIYFFLYWVGRNKADWSSASIEVLTWLNVKYIHSYKCCYMRRKEAFLAKFIQNIQSTKKYKKMKCPKSDAVMLTKKKQDVELSIMTLWQIQSKLNIRRTNTIGHFFGFGFGFDRSASFVEARIFLVHVISFMLSFMTFCTRNLTMKSLSWVSRFFSCLTKFYFRAFPDNFKYLVFFLLVE